MRRNSIRSNTSGDIASNMNYRIYARRILPNSDWAARTALGRMRRRPTLVESFWKQAELF
jgi:hypothetical protein